MRELKKCQLVTTINTEKDIERVYNVNLLSFDKALPGDLYLNKSRVSRVTVRQSKGVLTYRKLIATAIEEIWGEPKIPKDVVAMHLEGKIPNGYVMVQYKDGKPVVQDGFVLLKPLIPIKSEGGAIIKTIKTNDMKFTIEEIRKYLESQDSLGDIFYNLSEKSIIEANQPKEEE